MKTTLNTEIGTASRDNQSRRAYSLRELFLLVVVVAFAVMYFFPLQTKSVPTSKAPFSLFEPIEYRYWHQRGPNGSGTGKIGSGSEWMSANAIEVFENFIILHLDNGVDRMVERDGLEWFDWRRVDETSTGAKTARITSTSGH